MAIPNQKEFLSRVLRNNAQAVQLCELLFGISQVWDDIVDGDKPITAGNVNAAFWDALVTLPNNAFYRQNFDALNPMIQVAIQDWMDATRLENSQNLELCATSYVLRDTLSGLIIHCARIVGGYAWAQSHSLEIRRAVYDESLFDYLEEHGVSIIELQDEEPADG